ncbi:flagellar motor protein MotP [Radiobacillus kanasensis]|uniref:flagellar motor protein MotP n=1 Tax=Radiobacillus kanasensis TaxID=2844358 RepID=UPI001E5EB9EA|nr:flagellar motor protein MotP [Radiobacillus kanasensis]UFT98061.1 flagellar motor protein MotP [Radiobacillus kanasensis]
MKKVDLLTPVGITLGFLLIMFGILSSGGASGVVSFLDLASFFIVIGGLIAAILINFNRRQLKLTGQVLKEAFRQEQLPLPELIERFEMLSEKARREGLLSLEMEMESVQDPFLKKGILLAVDGYEPEVIRDILTAEIIAMEDRHQRGRAIIEKAGEYAPAWGMIGTLIGLVLMLKNLQDPSTLGPNMAVALLTTFYGTVLANLVFIPMASKLENRTDEEVFFKQIILEGVIGVQSGQNPHILREKLSAFLSTDMRKETKLGLDRNLTGETIHEA